MSICHCQYVNVISICQITIRSGIVSWDLLKENNLINFDFLDPDKILRIPIFAKDTDTWSK